MTDVVSTSKSWALYVFFGANVPDVEVRDAAVQNLLQMATVGSSDKISVAAQLHLPGPWAYRYVMPERPPGSNPVVIAPVEAIQNCNSADPKTIIDFFRWAARAYPADNIMFVVWGHGYGLDDYLPEGSRPHRLDPDATKPGARIPAMEDEALSMSSANVEFRISIDMVLTSIVQDHFWHQVLPNGQLGDALRKFLAEIKRNLSILALDACTMAMAEVWCELHGCANIGIASEAQEPDASFPYDRFLARLKLEPDAEPERVAKMVVDSYVESYAHDKNTYVTLSSCNLTGIADLEASVRHLAKALIMAAKDPIVRAAIFRARNESPIFDPDGFIDLGCFCEILEVLLPDTDVSAACKSVLEVLLDFVEYARYSPLDPRLLISQTTGLAVWFPPWLEDPAVDVPEKEASIAYLIYGYPHNAFAKKTGWHRFLESMWSLTRDEVRCLGNGTR
jgi:hypothetical protein